MSAPSVHSAPSKRIDQGGEALKWWAQFCDQAPRPENHRRPNADPGIRARLRRCRSNLEALGVPATLVLVRRLGLASPQSHVEDARTGAAIGLARVLAHIDEHDSKQLMQAAGWKSFPGDRRESEAGDDRPVLSEVRFRRLLQVEEGEEQIDAFIRLIKLLGRTASIPAVARDFLHWNDKTKQTWAFHYYAAGVAAPSNPTISDED